MSSKRASTIGSDGSSLKPSGPFFITLEGPDGAGKTTLLAALSKYLEERGIAHITTREPGGSSIGSAIRQILLHHGGELALRSELWLFMADRYQHVIEKIKPALEKGVWVLCDRFSDSSYAYQGDLRFIDDKILKEQLLQAADYLVPDKTFFIDLPPSLSLQRASLRKESSDRMEKKDLAFHQKVYERYHTLLSEEKSRFVVLDGKLSKEELARHACQCLELD